MSNIIRPIFRKTAVNALMDELRAAILKPDYDEVSISEVLGVLEMLKAEMLERTNAK